jgi:hypothetical protein
MLLLMTAKSVIQTLMLNYQRALYVKTVITLKRPMQVQHFVPDVQQVNTCQQIVLAQVVQKDTQVSMANPNAMNVFKESTPMITIRVQR